jgi:multidrug efflux system membrane fusion protein
MDTVMSGKNLRRGTAIAAALAAILAAVGYGWNTDASPAQPGGAPPVAVAAPLQRTVAVTRQYPGQVEAIERVELRPRVSGHILRVAFTEGSRVRKDQLLVQIDPAPYAAALAQAEAGHRQALAEASLAASEADRASRLASRNAISTEEVERRRAQASVAAARADEAAAAVARARLDLSHTRVVAPIDGRIGRAEITAGNLVGPADRLAVLVADAAVYVSFDVDEASLAKADADQWSATFALPDLPGRNFSGPVAFLDNEFAEGTGTVRARMRITGDPALLPGRFGQVTLQLGVDPDALLVDEKALGADQGTRYVLVVGQDDTLLYRPVQTGTRVGPYRVIEEGLAPGERVVVNGLMRVRPGMPVSPQEIPMTVAAGEAGPVATVSQVGE